MYPTIEDLKTIAESGVYRRIPVAREIYSDCFTPIEVMRTLRAASRHCYLLESAEDNQKWGRYSFLGCSPSLELTCRNGVLRIRRGDEDEIKEETISETLHPGRRYAGSSRNTKVRSWKICRLLPGACRIFLLRLH